MYNIKTLVKSLSKLKCPLGLHNTTTLYCGDRPLHMSYCLDCGSLWFVMIEHKRPIKITKIKEQKILFFLNQEINKIKQLEENRYNIIKNIADPGYRQSSETHEKELNTLRRIDCILDSYSPLSDYEKVYDFMKKVYSKKYEMKGAY